MAKKPVKKSAKAKVTKPKVAKPKAGSGTKKPTSATKAKTKRGIPVNSFSGPRVQILDILDSDNMSAGTQVPKNQDLKIAGWLTTFADKQTVNIQLFKVNDGMREGMPDLNASPATSPLGNTAYGVWTFTIPAANLNFDNQAFEIDAIAIDHTTSTASIITMG